MNYNCKSTRKGIIRWYNLLSKVNNYQISDQIFVKMTLITKFEKAI